MPRFPLTPIILSLAGLAFLISAVYHIPRIAQQPPPLPPEGQVVISPPAQLMMYAGDRFLAANVESIRAATITLDTIKDSALYRIRSHQAITQLNPCHEDNYYLGNASLTWGGMEQQGNTILQAAMECRFWDEIPPFLYGFNQYFFYQDTDKAVAALESAAERSSINAAPLHKLAIMITAEQFNDEKMALEYLRNQIAQTTDTKLIKMLEKRLQRLQGLLDLRAAQRQYETRHGKPLEKPSLLIESGILEAFPHDPLGLGYEFKHNTFRLRSMRIQGLGSE